MPKIGSFDTDKTCLLHRLEAHVKFGSSDLNQWIFDNMGVLPGMSVLDLGCGTGKQSIPLAGMVGKQGSVTAMDISLDSLNVLKDGAQESRVVVSTLQVPLDNLYQEDIGSFDRILASYSIYYVNNLKGLLGFLSSVMPQGVMFFCGPDETNNLEIKEFYKKACNVDLNLPGSAIMKDVITCCGEVFNNAQECKFENTLNFDSSDSLFQYWKSHNMYNEAMEATFLEAVESYFCRHEYFETTKRVVGVRIVK